MMIFPLDYDHYPRALQKARAQRWCARGKARVTHERFGSVIVPCSSKLTALENAAEFWKCEYSDISAAARVDLAGADEGPVRRPCELGEKCTVFQQKTHHAAFQPRRN